MTRFITPTFPDRHHGADRIEAMMDAAQQVPRTVSGQGGVALLLGSALAAAVAAVSYEVMDSAYESHLLMIWMVLWIALFAAMAVFAGSLVALGAGLRSRLGDWSRSLANAHADQQLWAMARHDDRIMSDLQSAMSRSEMLDGEIDAGAAVAAQALKTGRALKLQRY